MKVLFIISTEDAETSYNAIRLANVAVKKGDEVSVFMLGKGVLFERAGNEQFDVMGQINQFEGDFYVEIPRSGGIKFMPDWLDG